MVTNRPSPALVDSPAGGADLEAHLGARAPGCWRGHGSDRCAACYFPSEEQLVRHEQGVRKSIRTPDGGGGTTYRRTRPRDSQKRPPNGDRWTRPPPGKFGPTRSSACPWAASRRGRRWRGSWTSSSLRVPPPRREDRSALRCGSKTAIDEACAQTTRWDPNCRAPSYESPSSFPQSRGPGGEERLAGPRDAPPEVGSR